MKKIFLLALVFGLQGTLVFSADDEKPYERAYERAREMHTRSEKGGPEKKFVIRYQKNIDDTAIYETSPLTQEQLNKFLATNHGFLVVGVSPTEPTVPLVEEKMQGEVRFVVSFKRASDTAVSQTQPLNQAQLNHFLTKNPGYLVVGITTTEPIFPPLEESDKVNIRKIGE